MDRPRHQTAAAQNKKTILYVSDPSTIARKLLPDPVREDDLRQWVDMVADSGVDLFDQEVFSQGWTAYWQSDQYQYDQRHQHKRFLPLIEAGIQPLAVLIDQVHRRGMKFVAGFRINDGHAYQAREQGLDIAEFIASHPELQLRDMPSGQHFESTEPLDFSFEAVRQFTVGVFSEVAKAFDIDGAEMCMRDAAYFPQGRGVERADRMTDMVRQVRALLDERGAEIGRKLILGARVHPTIEECKSLGLDIATWIEAGLIDYISPQDMMYADFNLPYQQWAALTRNTDCHLYPAIQPWTSFRARYRRGQEPLSRANVRALAQTMYGSGGDGIAIYNHFVTWLGRPPFYPQAMQVFHQLGDPARLALGERHYVFDPTWAGQTGFGGEGKYSTGVVKANKLELNRGAHARGEYQFFLFEDLDNAHRATLLFRGFGLSEYDVLAVALNGQLIAAEAIGRTGQSDAQAVDGVYMREENGRKIPANPEQGRVDFRPEPAPFFSTRWFELRTGLVNWGENSLEITLLESAASADQPIVIDEVEIWVDPL